MSGCRCWASWREVGRNIVVECVVVWREAAGVRVGCGGIVLWREVELEDSRPRLMGFSGAFWVSVEVLVE